MDSGNNACLLFQVLLELLKLHFKLRFEVLAVLFQCVNHICRCHLTSFLIDLHQEIFDEVEFFARQVLSLPHMQDQVFVGLINQLLQFFLLSMEQACELLVNSRGHVSHSLLRNSIL